MHRQQEREAEVQVFSKPPRSCVFPVLNRQDLLEVARQALARNRREEARRAASWGCM